MRYCRTQSVDHELQTPDTGECANTLASRKNVEVMPGFIVANDETGFRDMARSHEFERILQYIARITAVSSAPDLSVPRCLRYEGD